jgi:FKBP-type peptidyl-prolyl cis-trans isomerase|eukprot:COSAG06_NODE_29330_length_558_cov_1.352941_1_plen_93_part_00
MYRLSLEDGTVIQTCKGFNSETNKKIEPLQFKVGTGAVIRGWDEALLEMSVGEESTITVEPHWAYGDKPPAETKIPKNATLVFEMRLLAASF